MKAKIILSSFLLCTVMFFQVNAQFGKVSVDYSVVDLIQKYEDYCNQLANNQSNTTAINNLRKLFSRYQSNTVANFFMTPRIDSLLAPKKGYQKIYGENILIAEKMPAEQYFNYLRYFFDQFYSPYTLRGTKPITLSITGRIKEYTKSNYSIYVVPVQQQVYYKGKRRDKKRRPPLSNTCYFSIIVPTNSYQSLTKSTIINISKDEPRYNLKPESINFITNIGSFSIAGQEKSSIFNSESYSFMADFEIYGFRNTTLYTNIGLGFGSFNQDFEFEDFIKIWQTTDIDGTPYARKAVLNFKEANQLKYFYIPLSLSLRSYLRKSSIGVNLFASLTQPIRVSSNFLEGHIVYSGLYDLSSIGLGKDVELTDLPENYMFGTYEVNGSSNNSPPLFPWLTFGIGLEYSRKIFQNFDVTMGLSYENSLLPINSDKHFPSFDSNQDQNSNYLLPGVGFSDNPKYSNANLNFGIRYHLQKPKTPFYSPRQQRDDLQRSKLKSNNYVINIGFTGSEEYNKMLDQTLSYYCVSMDGRLSFSLTKEGRIRSKKTKNQIKVPLNSITKRSGALVINKPFGYDVIIQNGELSADQYLDGENLFRFPIRNLVDNQVKDLEFELKNRPDLHIILVDLNGATTNIASKRSMVTNKIFDISQDIGQNINNGLDIEFYGYNEQMFPKWVGSISEVEALIGDINTMNGISSSTKLREAIIEGLNETKGSGIEFCGRRKLTLHCMVGSIDEFRSKTTNKGLKKEFLKPLLTRSENINNLPNIEIIIYYFGEQPQIEIDELSYRYIKLGDN